MEPSDKDTPRVGDEFEQVVDKLKSANSVLVTISTDPTVDQFAACIGLTLVLNKVGKHANAVFSGKVPSTIDFLKPDKTLEKNTDSLRDFIIALDKAKADKLRYKVEEDVVKIFITPYRTSISEKDLEFSQGDFNVDAIVALGIQDKNHIDEAILAHGRILHDAAVISINIAKQSKVGSINWTDARASSLCEMVADVAQELDSKVFDSQNATALLTGIVAETDRYSNDKAAPHTMSVAGLLMSAGASTQLVSSKLEEGAKNAPVASVITEGTSEAAENGVLEIQHQKNEAESKPLDIPRQEEPERKLDVPLESDVPSAAEENQPSEASPDNRPKMIHEPPEMGGQLTANTVSEDKRYSGSTDPLSNMPDIPMLKRESELTSDTLLPDVDDSSVAKGKNLQVDSNQTLSEIEKSIDSPHVNGDSDTSTSSQAGLDDARDAVMRAQATLNGENTRPEPRQDMGATSFDAGNSELPSPPVEPEVPDTNNNTPPPPAPPPFLPSST